MRIENYYSNTIKDWQTPGLKVSDGAAQEKNLEAGAQDAAQTDSIEISEAGRLAAEQERETEITEKETKNEEINEAESEEEETSEKQGGSVAVNAGKRARQIAAAKTRQQVQQVLALLQQDLAECKAGLEQGMCDESEVAKVEALMSAAQARLGQIPQNTEQEDNQIGLDAFDLASLM